MNRYDGRSWAYLEPNPGWFLVRWWWRFKLWFRYGWSQWRAEDLITDSRKKWETLYSSDHSFTSVASVVHDSGFDVFAGETAESLLKSKNIDGNFRREIFNPWVRGRYAQNLDTISALGAFMAADNSARLTISDGGMAGLWEGMVNSSAATVHLNTNVIGLRRGSWGGWVLASSSQSGGESYEAFDAVVLATPWSLTNLEIKGDALHVTPQNISYAEIYITLFTSAHGLARGRFSGQKGIPGLVLTTPCSWEYEYISGGTGKDGMGHAPFWSLSRVKDVVRAGKREYVYKVVSAKQLSDDDIQKMLGGREKSFSWVYRYYVSYRLYPLLTLHI